MCKGQSLPGFSSVVIIELNSWILEIVELDKIYPFLVTVVSIDLMTTLVILIM